MSLDGELRAVEYLEKTPDYAVVRVGAGCYLGVNPSDDSSTLENSLAYQLAAQGFALPITGGITHQSLGGFLQTGSAGGSLSYGIADGIEEIELVDGRGELVRLGRGSDELNAVGVGMGLFGVLTSVTLRVPPNYFVRGSEVNVELADSFVALHAGQSRLPEAMTDNEYLHLNWFPQRHVQRVMQWTGGRTAPTADILPYENTLRNRLVALIAAFILKVESGMLQVDADSEIVQETIGFLMRKFLPLNEPQSFCDVWYRTLPTDDQVLVDSLIKTHFTEVWLPVEQTDAALGRLVRLFDDEIAAGNFAVEIYSAKRSPFWLSAAHERDVVRIDPYWWAHNFGSPEDYFTRYWNALIDLPGARLHWGKYVPKPGQVCAGISFRRPFLEAAFPRLSDWLKLREKFDPHQVFLSDYWRNAFEIGSAS
jgi:D-arabinono-1,4-lactone oxidase